jgi:hypothetical protein
MITRAQKQQLRDLGYSDEQIREMKLAEARDILGKIAPTNPAEPPDYNELNTEPDPTKIAGVRGEALAGDRRQYHVTALQARANIRIGKTWQRGADGEPERVEEFGRLFDADTAHFETFPDLCRYLDRISGLKGVCIVYGDLRAGEHAERVRRLKHPRADGTDGTIIEARQRWLPIDFDWPNTDHEDDPFPADTIDPACDPDAAIDWVIERLVHHRPEFRGAAFRWQFTTKTGIRWRDGSLYKPGIYVRLYFPLDRSILNSEAARWLEDVSGIDTSIYSWEHEIFTKTHFVGIKDPLPRRIGYRGGAAVVVPHIRPAVPPLRLERRRDVFEITGNPILIAEGRRLKDEHIELHGQGTDTGNRALDLITKLGQLYTDDDKVLAAEDIAEIIEPEYQTPIGDIERLLNGQITRGDRRVEASAISNEAEEALGAEAQVDIESDPPTYLDPQAASEQLARDLEYAIRNPGEHLILGPAGLGKTTGSFDPAIRVTCGLRPEDMVEEIDEVEVEDILDEDLSQLGPDPNDKFWDQDLSLLPRDWQQVVYALPRHALAEEMAAKVRKKFNQYWMNEVVPIKKGYGQDLCKRRDEANALTAKGFPVYGNLCDNKQGRCPHFWNKDTGELCPMIAQRRENAQSPILFAMHGHVLTDRLECDKPPPDLTREPWEGGHYANLANAEPIIFDELPITALIDEITLRDSEIKKLSDILGIDVAAEARDNHLLRTLRTNDWTPEKLDTAIAKQEIFESRASYVLNPAVQNSPEEIAKLKPPPRVAKVLTRLRAELAVGREELNPRHAGRSYSLRLTEKGTIISQAIKELPLKHAIYLDATANADLWRMIKPNIQVAASLRVRRNAHITQITGTEKMVGHTFARSRLLDNDKPTALLKEAARFIAITAANHPGKTLVGADMKVRQAITSETDEERKARVAGQWAGADIAHFGAIRGCDDFKEHHTVIALGRDQISLDKLEQLAMAFRFDKPEPVRFAERDENGRGNYTLARRDHIMRDGSRRPGRFLVHPDPFAQALLEQIREAGITQLLDRLRLIHNTEPKRVIILCSIPLPGVEIDELVTWRELAGTRWLNRCLDNLAAGGKLHALPMSASWLADHFREEFPNAKDAENAVLRSASDWKTTDSSNPQKSISNYIWGNEGLKNPDASQCVSSWSLVKYRRAKQRGRRPSYAFVEEGYDPMIAIQEALGTSDQVIILPAETEAPAPEAAATSASNTERTVH